MGSPDVFMFGGDELIIIDYKYGKVDVKIENNSQLMIYALGVISTFQEFANEINIIKMIIYQPREGEIKATTISKTDLICWGNEVLRPAADAIYRNFKVENAGEWCEYCKGKEYCREH